MRLNVSRVAVFGGLMVMLAACEVAAPPHNKFPELTYGHLPKITFDVAEIEVVEAYRPSLEPPHVELIMPVSLNRSAARWGEDRLRADGTQGRLRYIVQEASVIETHLEGTQGIQDIFTVDQSERYDATLVIEVQVVGESGVVQGSATVAAKRTTTVAEDITLTEREQAWFILVERAMGDANGQLEVTLPEVFGGKFLR